MNDVVLRDIVNNTSSNSEGEKLYSILKRLFLNNQKAILNIDSEASMSSSFLNSSIGKFIENYGLEKLKHFLKIKGSKNQFSRLSDYIRRYNDTYSS